VFDELRKICRLPVSHIIYTYFHDDHVRSASVFHEPSTKIIAQRRMPEEREKLEKLLPYRTRANTLQFGAMLDGEARGVSLAYQTARPDPSLVQPGDPGGYIAPDAAAALAQVSRHVRKNRPLPASAPATTFKT
jgi:glyoxylase-like metal-dependent hydrolase (beta-lactamase superfamily II)